MGSGGVLNDTSGAAGLADPSFWVNLGVAGVFLALFLAGKISSQRTVQDLKDAHQRELEGLRGSHSAALAMQTLQLDRIISERNRALAERDEMIDVMKDFTHTASAILQVRPPTPPRRRENPR
jgi:hypothetical protein